MKIACFASASPHSLKYREDVLALGRKLGEKGHTLVFGGYADGLMKAIADGFHQSNAKIIGVVPDFFEDTHYHHVGCTSLIHVKTLAERKEIMIKEADAFLVLPGGVGTLDELMSVLALKTSGRLVKPVYIYNCDGFYNTLIELLEDMNKQGLIRSFDKLYKVVSNLEEVESMI